jgi:PadR family transcriptional regulator PadR
MEIFILGAAIATPNSISHTNYGPAVSVCKEGCWREKAAFQPRWTSLIYICRLSAMTQIRKFSEQTLVLLAGLMEQPRKWRHGYDLSRDTGLKSGTLYPILMRLCDRDVLQSKWEASSEPGRPPRHMYKLTSAGAALAAEQLAAKLNPDSLKHAVGNRA